MFTHYIWFSIFSDVMYKTLTFLVWEKIRLDDNQEAEIHPPGSWWPEQHYICKYLYNWEGVSKKGHNSTRIQYKAASIFWNIGSLHFEICSNKYLMTSHSIIFFNVKNTSFISKCNKNAIKVWVEMFIMKTNGPSSTINTPTSIL